MFMETTILKQANLDWSVKAERLVTAESNIETKSVAIVRQDNNAILGVHGDGYHPLQNSEMMEILDRISGKMGLPLHKGGYFGQGEKVYIQLKTQDLNVGTDKVKGYLTCVNSFDGSTSLAFGHSNLTISCQNTFFANYREMANKVRHTQKMHERIDIICMQIEDVLRAEQKIFQSITRMSEVKIDQKVRDMVLERILNLDKEERLADLTTLSTRKKNILSDLEVNIAGEVQDKGGNLWGLFSGITKYTTHSLKGDSNENKLFGVYGRREREVFAELSQLVS
jgi:phage/plasmid-like protein (TIGR03299 family)